MKKQIAYLIVAVSLAIVPATLTTGCSSTHSANQSANDKDITAHIKTSLDTDPVVKSTEVNVQSLRGEVQLSGFVDSQAAKDRAGQIAANTAGVVRVYNNLLVPTGR